MRILVSIFILLSCSNLVFGQESPELIAMKQIQEIQSGVLLVRLHADDIVIAKLKKQQLHATLKKKQKEVDERNRQIYDAFKTSFTFTNVYFFYGRNSEKVMGADYNGIFLNESLIEDTTISLPTNKPIYIVDVGDIYFEAFGGHFQGMMVMDKQFVPLQKPFPYFIRQRSGMAIIKRSFLDMVTLLQKKFEAFYSETVGKEI